MEMGMSSNYFGFSVLKPRLLVFWPCFRTAHVTLVWSFAHSSRESNGFFPVRVVRLIMTCIAFLYQKPTLARVPHVYHTGRFEKQHGRVVRQTFVLLGPTDGNLTIVRHRVSEPVQIQIPTFFPEHFMIIDQDQRHE